MGTRVNKRDIIKGILPLLYIMLNLTFWICPLVLLALTKIITPVLAIKTRCYQIMIAIYRKAVKTDRFLLKNLLRIRIDVDGMEALRRDKNYLVIVNHQSWADILVIQDILIERTPVIKFIVKKELIYLPLIGIICWAYEYPFVERSSFKAPLAVESKRRNDLKEMKNKLKGIMHHPAAIINFAEGTRFSRKKRDTHPSPHRLLLKPRTGGLYYILNTLGDHIDEVLDITIAYDCEVPEFFKFLSGHCETVRVEVNRIPVPALLSAFKDEGDELDFQKVDAWLKKRWFEKDQQLTRMRNTI